MLKPDSNLTVIAGVSGVGKTFLINKVVAKSCKYVHFSAGNLIRKRRENIGHDDLRLLEADEILENQHLLIDQLNLEKALVPSDAHILFDAHMIIDTDRAFVEIPLNIFESLNPSRIVFLYDDPEIILYRRVMDTSRERPAKTIEEIQSQQNRSRVLAQEYSDQLAIDFISYSSFEAIEFIVDSNLP